MSIWENVCCTEIISPSSTLCGWCWYYSPYYTAHWWFLYQRTEISQVWFVYWRVQIQMESILTKWLFYLLFNTNVRHDIIFAINQVARFTLAPKQSHRKAIKYIVCYYSNNTIDKGPIIKPESTYILRTCVDADFSRMHSQKPAGVSISHPKISNSQRGHQDNNSSYEEDLSAGPT